MATIKDVAKKANVSVATVSRVLNGTGYVHEETKLAINKVIEELNYSPNQYARFLSGSKTGIVGVLFPHLSSLFYSELLGGLENGAHSKRFKIMLANSNNNKALEKDYIEIFKKFNVDGLIIAANVLNPDDLIGFNKPIITIDHALDDSIPSITCDNISGGRLAAQELLNHNCKNILLLRGPSFLITTMDRTEGFLEIYNNVKDANIEIFDFDLINPDTSVIYQHLKSNPQIDGIFATSDLLAIAAQSQLKKLQRPLEKCKIVGYDNIKFSEIVTPSITTIEQPIEYLGLQAFNMLNKLMIGETLAQQHQVVEVKLIKRESTK